MYIREYSTIWHSLIELLICLDKYLPEVQKSQDKVLPNLKVFTVLKLHAVIRIFLVDSWPQNSFLS